jgi:hypothetical protein
MEDFTDEVLRNFYTKKAGGKKVQPWELEAMNNAQLSADRGDLLNRRKNLLDTKNYALANKNYDLSQAALDETVRNNNMTIATANAAREDAKSSGMTSSIVSPVVSLAGTDLLSKNSYIMDAGKWAANKLYPTETGVSPTVPESPTGYQSPYDMSTTTIPNVVDYAAAYTPEVLSGAELVASQGAAPITSGSPYLYPVADLGTTGGFTPVVEAATPLLAGSTTAGLSGAAGAGTAAGLEAAAFFGGGTGAATVPAAAGAGVAGTGMGLGATLGMAGAVMLGPSIVGHYLSKGMNAISRMGDTDYEPGAQENYAKDYQALVERQTKEGKPVPTPDQYNTILGGAIKEGYKPGVYLDAFDRVEKGFPQWGYTGDDPDVAAAVKAIQGGGWDVLHDGPLPIAEQMRVDATSNVFKQMGLWK